MPPGSAGASPRRRGPGSAPGEREGIQNLYQPAWIAVAGAYQPNLSALSWHADDIDRVHAVRLRERHMGHCHRRRIHLHARDHDHRRCLQWAGNHQVRGTNGGRDQAGLGVDTGRPASFRSYHAMMAARPAAERYMEVARTPGSVPTRWRCNLNIASSFACDSTKVHLWPPVQDGVLMVPVGCGQA